MVSKQSNYFRFEVKWQQHHWYAPSIQDSFSTSGLWRAHPFISNEVLLSCCDVMGLPRPSILWHWRLHPLNHTPGSFRRSIETDTYTIFKYFCQHCQLTLVCRSLYSCFNVFINCCLQLVPLREPFVSCWCCFREKSWLLVSLHALLWADTCCSSCSRRYIRALWLYRSLMAPSPGFWKHLSPRLPLCGQSVRWRCCLLVSWHGTHGYLQQQCSLTGKWSRSLSKLSSVSPGPAMPDCSDSQSDITKCQPP